VWPHHQAESPRRSNAWLQIQASHNLKHRSIKSHAILWMQCGKVHAYASLIDLVSKGESLQLLARVSASALQSHNVVRPCQMARCTTSFEPILNHRSSQTLEDFVACISISGLEHNGIMSEGLMLRSRSLATPRTKVLSLDYGAEVDDQAVPCSWNEPISPSTPVVPKGMAWMVHSWL
jgi:hypothetical protein